MLSVWVMRALDEDARQAFVDHEMVAITGGARVQDDMSGADSSEISKAVRSAGLSGNYTRMLDDLINRVRTGDMVLMPCDPAASRVVHVGRVVGDYQHVEDPPVAAAVHTRRVEWVGTSTREELGTEHFRGRLALYRTDDLSAEQVLSSVRG